MNILFIAPRLPYPADTGGKIRTFNIVKQLAQNNRVDLVCFAFEKNDEQYLDFFKQMNIYVHLVPAPKIALWKKAFVVTFHKQPFSIYKYNTLAMHKKVQEIVAQRKYDAVHIDHIHMAHYVEDCKKAPVYVDEHNVEYRILERCSGVAENWWVRFLYTRQAKRMRLFEQMMLQKVKGFFAVSSDDMQLLEQLIMPSRVETAVIPNGVDTEYFTAQKVEMEQALVFTGSMDWMPNNDAMVYFCEQIWPKIKQAESALKLYIVGKDPTDKLKNLAQQDTHIILTGRVDDVRMYMNKALVFVVPLRIGGGTRLKILEAMSMQKPVVSTSIGAEGIHYTDGHDIIIADKPDDFCQQVLQLLKNPNRCREIGQAGRVLVAGQYDWSIVGKQLTALYKKGG